MPTFATETVTAVLAHMNGDHPEDNLLIARAFATPEAVDATMVSLDELGGTWTYTLATAGAETELVVPWSTQISERGEIRREIVTLYDAACARLGVAPRPH
jgi:hypothetical protein